MTKDGGQVPDLSPTSSFLTWVPENFLVFPQFTSVFIQWCWWEHSLASLGDRHTHLILKLLAPQVVFHMHFLSFG